jgi:NAD(P)-dependent dehydrogenase (short-subunit alcohol dehydrogenase family)
MTVVAITGAGAGVGRATAREFARRGCDVGLISRDPERLEIAAAELRALGVRAFAAPADVADPAAVDGAAEAIEAALGPIDIWVNDAMATIFAAVHEIDAAEFRRATEVTYLGTVHGVQAALARMRPRGRGTIVNVGSALAYRSVPLQSAYCGAKAAIRGFTDSLRSELLHDRVDIRLTMVHLPAVNTPQFDWALNRTGHRAQPVPPIYAPEVPARAIVFAAFNPRREVWVGYPTVLAILANRIAPRFADRYLASHGYSGQLTAEPTVPDAPSNLFDPVSGRQGASGRFGAQARGGSWEMFTDRHKTAALSALAAIGAGALLGLHLLARSHDV